MKRTILYLLLSLWIVKQTAAQTNWKPGYVVLITGDTVTGEIDYLEWNYNPKEINFRAGGRDIKYSPNNIKDFQVTGQDHYKAAIVSYHNSASELFDAGKFFGDEVITDTVFLRLLFKAKTSLYELKTTRRTYYYYQTDNDPAAELVYRVRVQDNQLYKDEKYKLQLEDLLSRSEAPAYKINLDRIDYLEKDLIRYFKATQGQGSKPTQRKTPAKLDLSGGLAVIAHLPYRGSDSKYNTTIGWQAGPGITLPAKRYLGRYHIRIGINLNSQPFKAHYPGDQFRQAYDYSSTFNYVEPQLELLRSFNPLEKIQFLLGGYLGYNISLKKYLLFESNGSINPDPTARPLKGGGVHIGPAIAMKSGIHAWVLHLGWQSGVGTAGLQALSGIIIYRIIPF